MSEKIKVLVISDHPMAPSGVGTQTKYVINALLNTGRYKFICLGGAIKHNEYKPQKVEGHGEDWIIQPVDGYGTPEMVRSIIWNEKPDILWFMTDPRFYGWLWQLENEIRKNVPMVYYHVWDNYPYPMYNKRFKILMNLCSLNKTVRNLLFSGTTETQEENRVAHWYTGLTNSPKRSGRKT